MAAIVIIVNAFVDGRRGGNQVDVLLEADGLSTQQTQAVARLAGLSETAVVSASKVADFKLEFFTPSRQIAHCGHATIATFALFSQCGLVSGSKSSKETIAGAHRIVLRGGQAFME